MFNGEPKQTPENESGHSVHFTRHSKAGYKTYSKILKSDNPQQPVNVEDQVTPDLPEKGVEMARVAAEKFFETLDSSTDNLFFASSSEARALETANIYRQVAQERGFNILKPEHVRSELAEKIGEGDIRVVNGLSIKIANNLIGSVFNPDTHLGEVNFAAVDPETKEKWDRAREIINSDDKGSWGANFYHHSAAIKEIFPEIADAQDEYDTKFSKLVRLAKFSLDKAKESNVNGNVKVLAFGHESYIGYALNQYFSDNDIKNCETINIEPIEGQLSIERRGKKVKMIT